MTRVFVTSFAVDRLPERKSVLLQFEALGLRLSDFAAMDLGTILERVTRAPLESSGDGAGRPGPIVFEFVLQSDARELQRVARNR